MNIRRRSRWLAILIGIAMMLMQILMATVPHHRAGPTVDTHSRPAAHMTSGDFQAPVSASYRSTKPW
jgi:hypothetical protein